MAFTDLLWAYTTLECEPNTRPEALRDSYRELTKIWHPDRFQHDTALKGRCEKKMKDLNEAYRQVKSLGNLGLAISSPAPKPESKPEPRSPRAMDLTPVEFGSKWGFEDQDGRIVIDALFDSVSKFSEGLAAVELNGEFGYVGVSGRFVIPPRFTQAQEFSEGLAAVQLFYKWGYVDRSGTFAIRPRFEAANPFAEGFAGVKAHNKCGFIKPTGEWLVQPQFSEVFAFANGRAYARVDDRWAMVDRDGKVEFKYY